MHAPIRMMLTATLLLGALGVVACETYKKAPGEEGSAAVAATGGASAAPDETKAGGGTAKVAAKPAGAAKPGTASAGGASCAEVAETVIKVAMSQPNLDDAQRERMKALADRQRKVITQTCESTPWPANFRDCLAKATSGMEIQACRKFEPKPAAPPPRAPTPAP